jgi:hypothetical protein
MRTIASFCAHDVCQCIHVPVSVIYHARMLEVTPPTKVQCQQHGVSHKVAEVQVAEALTEHDAVRAHARDELGIDVDDHPNPWTAAAASAVCCLLAVS